LKRAAAVLIVLFALQLPLLHAQIADSGTGISFLAFGDVNLGRAVGQKILRGDTTYPFEEIFSLLERADIVYANLESPISDQNGETQSPKSNVIFCAPPAAAASLRRAGFTVVSTANNHAFDYGIKGLRETIRFLREQRLGFAGTAADSGAVFRAAIIECKGMKVGVVAYTQMVNFRFGWQGHISIFDSARARRDIEELKSSADFIIASYHGGEEYKSVPDAKTVRAVHTLAEFGVDVVVGHHPHVPQGIEIYRHCLIFHSLGNAVFYQPRMLWTQRSFAALLRLEKKGRRKTISSIQLLPFRPGLRPAMNLTSAEERELIDRTRKLSTVPIINTERGYFVKPFDAH
jgi:poly-gamma-glutamate capsule biosynthesis protein CapA/YwtB (metallophosphatase superfamily)